MPDLTDSPLFREAVEAVLGYPKPPECDEGSLHIRRSREGCFACRSLNQWQDAVDRIERALPFLRRLITEENAAKLEAEAMRPHRAGIPRNKGWYEAAAFLRREPTR